MIDWNKFKGERQQAETLSGIHPGHLERYFFAAGQVSGRVLDAACGCGYGSKIMQDSGSFVTGIDLEQDAIDYARKHYPGPEYILADVTTFPANYDCVVSLETIEHLPHPELALRQFRKARRLVASTPNELNYPFHPEKFAGDRFPHQRHYAPLEFERLLKDNGWTVRFQFCQIEKHTPVVPGTDGKFLVFVCE